MSRLLWLRYFLVHHRGKCPCYRLFYYRNSSFGVNKLRRLFPSDPHETWWPKSRYERQLIRPGVKSALEPSPRRNDKHSCEWKASGLNLKTLMTVLFIGYQTATFVLDDIGECMKETLPL